MERKKASDFHPELLSLFDRYIHGGISRREFLDGAQKFAVGGLTAAAILESLQPNYALAEQVPKTDSRIKTEYTSYPSPQGNSMTKGYLVRPANARGKLPGVLVVHENRGLNPYVEDVARRLGVANFIAYAPDALAPLGGYPGDDEKGGADFAKLDGTKRTEDFVAAANYLKGLPDCTGKIGAVGFCFGGGVANTLATRIPEVAAAAPYYGAQPSAAEVAKIKGALLIHYAGDDQRINAGWPAYEAALKANKIPYEMFMYAGTMHGFHNDTTPRYDKAAAELSWSRTLAHFNKYLRTS
ncbi:MAG TPA: dienelactone hydrolase family protein [Terriglobia bacterium]|nr:dienelactone hydrolase family protein [Terriglobia bacterium]